MFDIKNIKEYSGETFEAVVTLGGSMFELGSTKTIINRLKTTVKSLKNYMHFHFCTMIWEISFLHLEFMNWVL